MSNFDNIWHNERRRTNVITLRSSHSSCFVVSTCIRLTHSLSARHLLSFWLSLFLDRSLACPSIVSMCAPLYGHMCVCVSIHAYLHLLTYTHINTICFPRISMCACACACTCEHIHNSWLFVPNILWWCNTAHRKLYILTRSLLRFVYSSISFHIFLRHCNTLHLFFSWQSRFLRIYISRNNQMNWEMFKMKQKEKKTAIEMIWNE